MIYEYLYLKGNANVPLRHDYIFKAKTIRFYENARIYTQQHKHKLFFLGTLRSKT